jgi:small subunit ribosomal protein S20
VVNAVKANDKEKAEEALKVANRQIHKMVSKGFLKKRTASRKVSRLSLLVNKLKVA